MVIRDVLPSDAAEACEVVRRFIVELCRELDHEGDPGILAKGLANKTLENFMCWIQSSGHREMVAERDGFLAGFGHLSLQDGKVSLLDVAQEVKGQRG